VIQN
jgi:hypothetical protein